MKKAFVTLLSVSILLPGLAPVQAAERPVSVRGVRPLGMGDAFTAVADDQNVFFYNPAGTVQRSGSMFTLLELPVIIGTDLLDAMDFISDNEDKLTKFNELTPTQQADLINEMDRTITQLHPHVGVGGPNTSFLSGPIGEGRWHWGFGGFGQVEGSFKVNSGIVPSLDYDINADALASLNIAKRWDEVWGVPGKLGVGVNLKYLNRNQVKDERVSFLQLEDFESPPLQTGSGYGADLGFLYQPTSRWNLGLASLDFLGTSVDFDAADPEKGFLAKPSRTGTIKSRWNVGFAWTPSRLGVEGFSIPTGDRLLLAMDVKDIFNAQSKVLFGDDLVPDTAWTHVHLGAEYRWWFLRFRGGANQGYPTFGLGLDIPLLKVDYAYFSDELGKTAGTQDQSNHMITLALRFGASKTEARERIKERKRAKKAAKEAAQEAAPPAEAAPAMPETPADAVPADATVPAEAAPVVPEAVPATAQ
jgi:hypothetical protein